MTRFSVRVDPEAERQFDEILDWLESQFSQKLSDQVNERLEEVLLGLAKLPYAWPEERLKSGLTVRKAQINNRTLIFYTVDEGSHIINVVEIAAARMDWK